MCSIGDIAVDGAAVVLMGAICEDPVPENIPESDIGKKLLSRPSREHSRILHHPSSAPVDTVGVPECGWERSREPGGRRWTSTNTTYPRGRTMHTTITTQLEQRLARCNSPRRRTQIMTRWATNPALAGHTPSDIVDICHRPTTDQNPVVAALLALHQNGDDDATTILMAALRPMVLAAAAVRRAGPIRDNTLDNDWVAVAHVLATVDPTVEPTDSDGQPAVFFAFLGQQIGRSRRTFDPAARRWLVRHQRGMPLGGTVPPHDPTTYEFDLRAGTTSASAVEDGAIALIELRRIAHVVASGQIQRSRWEQLVAHRIGDPRGAPPAGTRVAVHRTTRRLAYLVDHAA
jgi:hypothetical protein